MTEQWGRLLTGPECKALVLPGDMAAQYWTRAAQNTGRVAHFPFACAEACYRLPANSAAYIVADWNRDHPDQPHFRYWAGGEEAPGDWDGEERLYRNGYTSRTIVMHPRWHWSDDPEELDFDCVGYRTRIPAESANCPGVGENGEGPAEIWLESECCSDPREGRCWSPDVPDECDNGCKPTRYIRADLVPEAASLIERMEGRLTAADVLDQIGQAQRDAFTLAAKAARGDTHPLYCGGFDEAGNMLPGSPYDRGRADAAAAIDKLQTRGGSDG